MQLTKHSDYALRTLIYLSIYKDKRVRLKEISLAYQISHNHLVKVVQKLVQSGFIVTLPGRSGGMWLARSPNQINLAKVLRAVEPNFALVECQSASGGGCVISPICALKSVIDEARASFFTVLQKYNLSDIVENKDDLILLLNGNATLNLPKL